MLEAKFGSDYLERVINVSGSKRYMFVPQCILFAWIEASDM